MGESISSPSLSCHRCEPRCFLFLILWRREITAAHPSQIKVKSSRQRLAYRSRVSGDVGNRGAPSLEFSSLGGQLAVMLGGQTQSLIAMASTEMHHGPSQWRVSTPDACFATQLPLFWKQEKASTWPVHAQTVWHSQARWNSCDAGALFPLGGLTVALWQSLTPRHGGE